LGESGSFSADAGKDRRQQDRPLRGAKGYDGGEVAGLREILGFVDNGELTQLMRHEFQAIRFVEGTP